MILPARVTDLENRFDARAKKMTGADLAVFRATLNKVNTDVGMIWKHQIMMPIGLIVEELKEEIPILDLTADSPKKKKKEGKKGQE